MVTLKIVVDHTPKYWNHVHQITIPECWEVTCFNLNEVMDAEHWDHYQLRSIGKTKKKAIKNFKLQAKKMFPEGAAILILTGSA